MTHLYFVAVDKGDTLGSYVECQRCAGCFKPAVLALHHEELRQDAAVLRRLLAAVAVIPDGPPLGEAEIREAYREAAGHDIEGVSAELARVKADPTALWDLALEARPDLQPETARAMVQAGITMATRDAAMGFRRRQLLLLLAETFQVSPVFPRGETIAP